MSDNINKTLPVLDILKNSYSAVIANIKPFIIFSYVLCAPIYLLSTIMPPAASNIDDVSYTSIITYLILSVIILIIINTFFYRLFSVGKSQLFKINPPQLLKIFSKMAIYLFVLAFLLFITLLAVVLIFGLAVSIVSEIAGDSALSEALMRSVVNFALLIAILLVNMRLQPTFISIAINKVSIPMKSAFYYTRDNNKELILIGLFSFIPALLPSTICFMIIGMLNLDPNYVNILAFLLFPLLLLPNVLILSAGIEVYKYLLPEQLNQEMDVSV